MSNGVYEKLKNCYESIKNRVPLKPKIALVLGSGLGDFADTSMKAMFYRKDSPARCADSRRMFSNRSNKFKKGKGIK